jgi:hypothetical protein
MSNDKITIDGIFLARSAGAAMESLEKAVLIQGVGIQGDRYAQQAGTYSVLLPKEPGRQLTLISADSVEEVFSTSLSSCTSTNTTIRNKNQGKLMKLNSVGDLRRNVVLRGISGKQLLQSIGHVLTLGKTCQILVHRNCVPCMYNEKRNQIPGLMEGLWEVGGVNAEILVGGDICVGDEVEINNGKIYPVDDGDKPEWFYLRPSKRSLQMIQQGIESKRQSKAILLETDPEGVKRSETSFAAVGLSFFPPDK